MALPNFFGVVTLKRDSKEKKIENKTLINPPNFHYTFLQNEV